MKKLLFALQDTHVSFCRGSEPSYEAASASDLTEKAELTLQRTVLFTKYSEYNLFARCWVVDGTPRYLYVSRDRSIALFSKDVRAVILWA